MIQNYDFKIVYESANLSSEEIISLRKKFLDLFYQTGFPIFEDEHWKFSDLNSISSHHLKTFG